MKKLLILILSLILVLTLIACAVNEGDTGTEGTDESTVAPSDDGDDRELDEQLKLDNLSTVTVDTTKTHQTIESFGASGCWWAQVVGGNEKTREKSAATSFV